VIAGILPFDKERHLLVVETLVLG